MTCGLLFSFLPESACREEGMPDLILPPACIQIRSSQQSRPGPFFSAPHRRALRFRPPASGGVGEAEPPLPAGRPPPAKGVRESVLKGGVLILFLLPPPSSPRSLPLHWATSLPALEAPPAPHPRSHKLRRGQATVLVRAGPRKARSGGLSARALALKEEGDDDRRSL